MNGMERYVSQVRFNTFPERPMLHVVYSQDQEVHCHCCGELLTADGREQLTCSSGNRVYTLQPPIKPESNVGSVEIKRWLEERYLVDALRRQGGGDTERVAEELRAARDQKLTNADDAGPRYLNAENLRDQAAKIERLRVLLLEALEVQPHRSRRDNADQGGG